MTTEKKTWLITGAGRGMGLDIAKAALAAGHNVVATGRNPDAVAEAVGDSDHLLVVRLDVTSTQDAEAAVKAAVDRFGGIDVLVNNAASFYAGFFEELTPEQMDRQITTSLIGPMNVTRAVLPVMRKQRSGHVVTISSSAGFAGFEYGTAYAASKFGVDGWMESLAPEIEPFGIHTTVVNPGFFRTELLTQGVDELRPGVDRGLRRAQRRPARVLGEHERPAGRRPRQARPGAADHHRPGAAAVPVHRRRRRARAGRGEARRTPAADRRLPRPLLVARARRGRRHEHRSAHRPRRGHHRRLVGHRRGDRPRAGRRRPPGRAAGPPRDRIQALADELGDGAIAIEADVTDRESVVAAADRVQQELGGADILVNNAGVMLTAPFSSDQREEHRRMVETNLLGAMTATEVFLDQLRDRGGDLVNVSSVAGRVAPAGFAAYAATKWGINGWSEALRVELQPDIRVTVIEPGAIATELTDHITDPASKRANKKRRPRWGSPRRTSPTSSPSPSAGRSA